MSLDSKKVTSYFREFRKHADCGQLKGGTQHKDKIASRNLESRPGSPDLRPEAT